MYISSASFHYCIKLNSEFSQEEAAVKAGKLKAFSLVIVEILQENDPMFRLKSSLKNLNMT